MVFLAVAGCATIKPDEKIQESINLVEKQTGERPAWLAPWDSLPPPWDGQSTLGVDEAVALALRNNRELRADLEMIGKANADLVQAGLWQNPRFNFMVMFPDGGGRSMLRSAGFPVQALQELWLIPARKEVATAQLQEAVLRVADRAVEIASEIKAIYARLRYAQRAVELIRESLDVVDRTRQLIQTQQAAGKATLVQVNVARIRHQRLQSELLTMQAEYKSFQRRLLLQMGFPSAMDTWAVVPVHELQEPLDSPPAEETLMSTAEEQRLDLQAARWTLLAAERRINLMRREGWPEVALGLSFERAPAPPSQNPSVAGRLGNAAAGSLAGNAPEPTPIMPFAPAEQEIEWTVGPMIDLELPIFDWNQGQTAKAFHEFKQRWAEYDGRRQSVAAKVRETAVMYQQACEQVRLFRDAVLPEVDRNLELVRESYRAGKEDVTVFLQVQEDLIMTRLNALAFVRDMLVNRAELERQVGGRLEDATTIEKGEQDAHSPEPANGENENEKD